MNIAKKFSSALLFAFALLCTSISQADVTVTYGSLESGSRFIDLVGDTANQGVMFFVSDVAANGGVDGVEFNIQVGDGGTALGGNDVGPVITSIDLITDTIWEGSNPTQDDVVDTPLAKQSTVFTSSVVNQDGKFATVFFDTTGISSGIIPLSLINVAGNNDTVFFNGLPEVDTNVSNGFLRITTVPEPSGIFAVLGLVGFAVRRRRV